MYTHHFDVIHILCFLAFYSNILLLHAQGVPHLVCQCLALLGSSHPFVEEGCDVDVAEEVN